MKSGSAAESEPFLDQERRLAAPLARRQRRALPCEARPPHAEPRSRSRARSSVQSVSLQSYGIARRLLAWLGQSLPGSDAGHPCTVWVAMRKRQRDM